MKNLQHGLEPLFVQIIRGVTMFMSNTLKEKIPIFYLFPHPYGIWMRKLFSRQLNAMHKHIWRNPWLNFPATWWNTRKIGGGRKRKKSSNMSNNKNVGSKRRLHKSKKATQEENKAAERIKKGCRRRYKQCCRRSTLRSFPGTWLTCQVTAIVLSNQAIQDTLSTYLLNREK